MSLVDSVFARAGPIFGLRLQTQQRVLHFFVLGPQRQRLLGQLAGSVCVAFRKLLLHDPAHPDKTGRLVRQQTFIGLRRLVGVAAHLSRLGHQQIGQLRLLQVFLSPRCLGQRQAPLARSQRHQPVGQRLVALALAALVPITRQGGFVAIQEMQRRNQQRQQFQEQPDAHNQHTQRDNGLQRA